MNSSWMVLLIALIVILLLSVIWNIYYIYNNKKNGMNCNEIVLMMKARISKDDLHTTCSIVLPNTDHDIAEALQYVRPSKYAGNLLENLYEQTRV